MSDDLFDGIDDLLAKHPGPWRSFNTGVVMDANGDAVSCTSWHMAQAVNRIGELQRDRDENCNPAYKVILNTVSAERDSLKAKVEELERELSACDQMRRIWLNRYNSEHGNYDQRRFEAACAAMQCVFASQPVQTSKEVYARLSVEMGDALLDELAKPKEGTT